MSNGSEAMLDSQEYEDQGTNGMTVHTPTALCEHLPAAHSKFHTLIRRVLLSGTRLICPATHRPHATGVDCDVRSRRGHFICVSRPAIPSDCSFNRRGQEHRCCRAREGRLGSRCGHGLDDCFHQVCRGHLSRLWPSKEAPVSAGRLLYACLSHQIIPPETQACFVVSASGLEVPRESWFGSAIGLL